MKFADMEKHIYFVRHGESEENRDRLYIGPNAELTDVGREQAHMLAERIHRIGVEALISSPFLRARDTAVSITERTGIVLELNEFLGEWLEPSHVIGLHVDDPERKSTLEAMRGVTDNHDYRHSDEETFSELVARAKAAICTLKEHSAERICVVTHGGFLRVIIGVMIFGSEFTKKDFVRLLHHFLTTNTGITYVKFEDETLGWRLVTWNDQSHLG